MPNFVLNYIVNFIALGPTEAAAGDDDDLAAVAVVSLALLFFHFIHGRGHGRDMAVAAMGIEVPTRSTVTSVVLITRLGVTGGSFVLVSWPGFWRRDAARTRSRGRLRYQPAQVDHPSDCSRLASLMVLF